MCENREKIRQAVTNTIIDGWNEAVQALQICWTDGDGILTELG
jgi:hypothetical protein